jgi:hypothetical protein
VVAPLQVTTLPDCRQAAAAGFAGITAAATSGRTNGAARSGHRPALAFAVASTDFVHAAPSICFISHSRVLRPKQPCQAK